MEQTDTMLKISKAELGAHLSRDELDSLYFMPITVPEYLTQDQLERLKILFRGEPKTKPEPAYAKALADDINARVSELAEIDPKAIERLPIYFRGYRHGLADAHEALSFMWEE